MYHPVLQKPRKVGGLPFVARAAPGQVVGLLLNSGQPRVQPVLQSPGRACPFRQTDGAMQSESCESVNTSSA